MIIKLRSKRHGEHVHTSVFMGADQDHMQCTGVLVTDIGQWQLFGAAMLMGAQKANGHLEVIVEGDEQVVQIVKGE